MPEPRERDSRRRAARPRRCEPGSNSRLRTGTSPPRESTRWTSRSMKSARCRGGSRAVRAFLPGHGATRHGGVTNGSACNCGRMHLRALTTQASPRRARQSALVAVLPIVTCDVATPPHRVPPHPSIRPHPQKGDSPLFQRVNSQNVTHDTPPYVDFTGGRLAMGSTGSGQGAPLVWT